MADLVFATGAVHDDFGPVTSFAAITERGAEWVQTYGIDGSYVIETHLEDLTIAAIEGEGLTVAAA